ncbi:MAG TPA: DUF4382 domain-containing protein [Steroidobacteraceae bacterium]|nr:DUF4382 domain-containing protein [Steroidobacteraceae bacterium]
MNRHDAHRRRGCGLTSFLPRLLAALAIAGAAGLSACGGGGASNFTTNSNGVAMVTVTDAPGDFLSYVVNAVSLKLTRADGSAVETLPAATKLDFAHLVDLSEVISARQVPAGSYTGVALTVDFNGAAIVVDNGGSGLQVPAANIIDGGTGNALNAPNTTQLTLSLTLDSKAPLVVTGKTVANLALDFNLSASNTVAPASIASTTAASTVTVTVHPILSASLTPDVSKQIRLRGKLLSADTTAGTYTVNVRPFEDAADDDHGQMVVKTTATTSFTLNGTAYTASAGLAALAALAAGTLAAATGTFDTQSGTFTATAVFAGTSVPGAGLDSVEGTVTARSGNVLSVSHGWVDGRDRDDEQFTPQIAVTVAGTTAVTEDGQTGSFTDQDISVGQHLQVFGTFGADTSGNRTLDASSGSARLMVTPLWGQFTSSAAGVVTVNLQSLGGREASAFNFAGTGGGAANDASASAYQVKVPAAVPVPSVTAGFPIRFSGFVTPFGAAPPDFSALSVVDFSSTNALLLIEWAFPGDANPFTSPLSAGNVAIVQSVLQGAQVHVILIGPQKLDPAALSGGLSFVPSTATGPMTFAIAHTDTRAIDTFSTFADFISALSGDLVGMTEVRAVAAEGTYDQTSGVMTVTRMLVAISGH